MIKKIARWISRTELDILRDVGESFYDKTLVLRREINHLKDIIVKDDKKSMVEIKTTRERQTRMNGMQIK